MHCLYDIDGVLRYVGNDRDACLAYAELFNLPSSTYSLMALPDNEKINRNPIKKKASRIIR
tara:strand:- start:4271 stop:4453 length:183 start_codon:yes stop_codon:yes gene_type:complete